MIISLKNYLWGVLVGMYFTEKVLGISQTHRLCIWQRDQKTRDKRTDQNSNFRAVRLPVEPLMNHGWCSQLVLWAGVCHLQEPRVSGLPTLWAGVQLIGRAWNTCHDPHGVLVMWGRGSNARMYSVDLLSISEGGGGGDGLWVFLIYMPNIYIGSDERQEGQAKTWSPVITFIKGNDISRKQVNLTKQQNTRSIYKILY